MPVAERTYRGCKRARPSQRDIDDAHLIEAIRAARVSDKGEAALESLYGRRRMAALLRWRGIAAFSRRVNQEMRQLGIKGWCEAGACGPRRRIPRRLALRICWITSSPPLPRTGGGWLAAPTCARGQGLSMSHS